MRQASWNEMFAPRREYHGIVPEVPVEPRGWRRIFWWEELVTFALLSAVLIAVVASVDRAGWVDGMPLLYPIAFLGLTMAALLARVRWPEVVLHALALLVGSAAALGQVLAVVPGSTPVTRYQELHERMGVWFSAAFTGGISNDDLPFIVLVVAVSWLAAYLSAWAVFRWRNVWLALGCSGTVLLANISYLPGQFSFSFVVFLIAGALLVTRLHVSERAGGWREEGVAYPPLLSLSVLHATFWIALVLVAAAWLMPSANEASGVEPLWRRATAPVEERIESLGRLFTGVNGRGSVEVHSFDDILPFVGSLGELPNGAVVQVSSEAFDDPRYLRAQAYVVYTPAGWRQGPTAESSLERREVTGADADLLARDAVTIDVVVTGDARAPVLSVGQPRRVSRDVELTSALIEADILRSTADLDRGDRYESTGTVSVATEEDLRGAGIRYPNWVSERYLGLSGDLPNTVRSFAYEIAGSQRNDYDKALAVESYLRTVPYDLDVPPPPAGADAIEYFLFDARRGFFDYHASAMVVLLRALNVPSRLAVGYVLPPNPDGGASFITERNAYAWAEVYFPDYGWVEFNPTPNLPSIERPDTASDAPAAGAGGDPGIADLGFGDVGALFPDDGTAGLDGAAIDGAGGGMPGWLIALPAALAGLAVAAAAGVAVAWQRGLASLEPPARRWAQTVRLASWARIPPRPSQTAREYARTLQSEVAGLEDVDVISDAYGAHRYGRRAADEARLDDAWRSVRGRLLRRLLRLR